MTSADHAENRFAPRPVPPPETAKGILRPRQQNAANNHARLPAGERVARYVEWYWAVRWDRRGEPPFLAEVLPYPCVNLTFERTHERTGAFVTGVWTTKYVRELAGAGETFGVKFRAGGFGAFTGLDVGALSDTSVPAAQIFPAADALAEAVLATEDTLRRRELIEDFLEAAQGAEGDQRAYRQVLAIIEAMEHDRDLTRVDQVTERFDIPVRTLQRLFRRYVGAGPKWVLRRYRLQDGAHLLAEGRTSDLAALALELGYFDQAHFSNEFAKEIGMPPLEYARISLPS
ncbi:AraC family transcriptional regulator [Nocardia tengchongensis]|uniref:AraC family transcriptional regulator n=1 Tax=Nocardia tengchongensis TaxID=2055889 RepID=A0ABX8CYI6_9NOCA|nr:helix-turn-helix domain-containing protein [Nocardia tengchongensis]QVI24539.1 AraC family transcriptional regulator [Nocardia tengchongensis]